MNVHTQDPDIDAAPLALFVFRRPEHTRRTLEALARNPGFEQTPLVIYCDGARRPGDEAAVAEVRHIVRAWPHPRKTVVEAPANRGLARSIIDGVDSLCRRHGAAIVVEDDLVVEPGFLDYMQRSLRRYAQDPRLMQVSGYMFPVAQAAERGSLLLPMTTSWGWATWRRAWQRFDPSAASAARLASSLALRYRFDLDGSYPYFDMLQRQLRGESDSWAIRWYLSVFLAGGLVLYPGRTLVRNDGFDGSGTHCEQRPAAPNVVQGSAAAIDLEATADAAVFDAVKRHLRRDRGWVALARDWRHRLAPDTRLLAHGAGT